MIKLAPSLPSLSLALSRPKNSLIATPDNTHVSSYISAQIAISRDIGSIDKLDTGLSPETLRMTDG